MADAAKATPPPLLVLLLPPRATGSARSLGDWRRRVVGGMERAVATVSVLSVATRIDAYYVVSELRGAKLYSQFERARPQVWLS